MVPVTRVFEGPIGQIQDAARRRLGHPIDWPDLPAALAMSICDRYDMQYPDTWLTDLLRSESPQFRHAPVIAAYGFVLDKTAPRVREMWASAIQTLRGRVPFPRDRGSFEYSARELAGIARGLALLDPDPNAHASWFSDLLTRGLISNRFNSPVLRFAAVLALNHIDPAQARSTDTSTPDIDSLSMRELSLVTQVRLAIGADDILSTNALEAAFRVRHAEERVTISDAGEAAALAYLCARVLDSLALRDTSADPLDTVLALCRRFHLFARQLAHRHNDRTAFTIADEYDVQDLFHAILLLHFDDVRPEEVTPSYAGHSSRVDFYLPDARMIVEVKMTRDSLGQRKVADQLIEDAARYASMKHVDTLVCLVYDPGNHCHNPTALERDVAESGRTLSVHAVVCPRGV